MREIRFGLERGVDVSRYNNSKYRWKIMKKIREELEAQS